MNSEIVGVVRRFDDLGRVTIPKEMRRELCLDPYGIVEIHIEDGKLILTPSTGISEVRSTLSAGALTIANSDIQNKDEIMKLIGETKKLVTSDVNNK